MARFTTQYVGVRLLASPLNSTKRELKHVPTHHYIKVKAISKQNHKTTPFQKAIYLAWHFLIRLGSPNSQDPCPSTPQFPNATPITRFLHETSYPLRNWWLHIFCLWGCSQWLANILLCSRSQTRTASLSDRDYGVVDRCRMEMRMMRDLVFWVRVVMNEDEGLSKKAISIS